MAQIHKVEVEQVVRHELDARRGVVARKEEVLKASGAHRISIEGQTFDAVDGTFDVPAEVAAIFLAQPGWFEGPNPFSIDLDAVRVDSEAREDIARQRADLELQSKALEAERQKLASDREALRVAQGAGEKK